MHTTFHFVNYFAFYLGHITSNVQQAINDFHRKTCLRFVNYVSGYHKNYIEFDNSYGYAIIYIF